MDKPNLRIGRNISGGEEGVHPRIGVPIRLTTGLSVPVRQADFHRIGAPAQLTGALSSPEALFGSVRSGTPIRLAGSLSSPSAGYERPNAGTPVRLTGTLSSPQVSYVRRPTPTPIGLAFTMSQPPVDGDLSRTGTPIRLAGTLSQPQAGYVTGRVGNPIALAGTLSSPTADHTPGGETRLWDFRDPDAMPEGWEYVRAGVLAEYGPGGTMRFGRENTLTQSNTFDHADWVKNGTTVTPGQGDPDSGTAATKLAEDTNNGQHVIDQGKASAGYGFFAGARVCYQIQVKAAERTFCSILFGGTCFANPAYANFNLTTGAAGAASNASIVDIEDRGNGWYRITAEATFTGITDDPTISVCVLDGDNDPTAGYQGVADNGILIYKARQWRTPGDGTPAQMAALAETTADFYYHPVVVHDAASQPVGMRAQPQATYSMLDGRGFLASPWSTLNTGSRNRDAVNDFGLTNTAATVDDTDAAAAYGLRNDHTVTINNLTVAFGFSLKADAAYPNVPEMRGRSRNGGTVAEQRLVQMNMETGEVDARSITGTGVYGSCPAPGRFIVQIVVDKAGTEDNIRAEVLPAAILKSAFPPAATPVGSLQGAVVLDSVYTVTDLLDGNNAGAMMLPSEGFARGAEVTKPQIAIRAPLSSINQPIGNGRWDVYVMFPSIRVNRTGTAQYVFRLDNGSNRAYVRLSQSANQSQMKVIIRDDAPVNIFNDVDVGVGINDVVDGQVHKLSWHIYEGDQKFSWDDGTPQTNNLTGIVFTNYIRGWIGQDASLYQMPIVIQAIDYTAGGTVT